MRFLPIQLIPFKIIFFRPLLQLKNTYHHCIDQKVLKF